MSVTLWPTGLVLTDALAARLDAACVDRWLLRYRDEHGGDDPPGWPGVNGHRALAEWSVMQLGVGFVLHWERRQAEAAIPSEPW